MNILAIDLASRKSVYGISCDFKQKPTYETIPTDPQIMTELIIDSKPDLVVFEVGTEAGWLSDICRNLNVPFKVANTADERWKWKRARAKSDRKDVDRLLHLAHTEEFPEVYIPELETRAYRALVNARQETVELRTAVKNQIRATLKKVGKKMPGKTAWTKQSLACLDQEAKPITECSANELWRGTLFILLEQIRLLNQHEEEFNKKLAASPLHQEEKKLLRSVPGVGERVAEKFTLCIDDPKRFGNARQVGCYFGLTSRVFQSGEMNIQGKISRMGDSRMRALLVEAAWVAIRYDPHLKEYFNRVWRGIKGRKKIAIVAVARKIACAMWAMLRDKRKWDGSLVAPV